MISTFHIELMDFIVKTCNNMDKEFEENNYISIKWICDQYKGTLSASSIRYHLDVLWGNGLVAYFYNDDLMLKCVIPIKNWDEKKITLCSRKPQKQKKHKCGPKKKRDVRFKDVVGKCDMCGNPGRLTTMKIGMNIVKLCRNCLCPDKELTIEDFSGFKESSICLA